MCRRKLKYCIMLFAGAKEKDKDGRLPLWEAWENTAPVNVLFVLIQAYPDGEAVLLCCPTAFLASVRVVAKRRDSTLCCLIMSMLMFFVQ